MHITLMYTEIMRHRELAHAVREAKCRQRKKVTCVHACCEQGTTAICPNKAVPKVNTPQQSMGGLAAAAGALSECRDHIITLFE